MAAISSRAGLYKLVFFILVGAGATLWPRGCHNPVAARLSRLPLFAGCFSLQCFEGCASHGRHVSWKRLCLDNESCASWKSSCVQCL